MIINQSTLAALFYDFKQLFQGAYDVAPTMWEQVATSISSSTREERYPFIGAIPQMRQWLGERVLHNLASRAYTLANLDYEDTVQVDRNDIEDDRLGIYGVSMKQLGMAARQHFDILLAATLEAGTTATGFDGQAFFSTAHPINQEGTVSGTYSNLYSTAGSGATLLTAANFNSMRTVMMKYKNDAGVPLGIRPTTLVVPPALEVTARQIVQATWMAPTGAVGAQTTQPGENMLRGLANVVVCDYLTSDTAWYLLDTSRAIKPLIMQIRKPAEFVALDRPDSPNVFQRRQFIYGVSDRKACGYTLPFLALKGDA